ncbi:hypothetical protein GLOIN_2v1479874 [Rhizophagus clarus]|uniref:Uncharacterized protein n=1 Tax=Rhizophagus clarus TaxID=94130 RepID=A0A8H3R0X0_9GLOM|nr:hypothetical protein GLOIN_2v1479874 [Rhizophagus clarus]
MIAHLQLLDDQSHYNRKRVSQPEESEVDPDSDSNKTYKRRRKRVFDNSRYAPDEETAPLNASWAVKNYKDNVNDPINTRHHSSRKKSRSTEEAEDAD